MGGVVIPDTVAIMAIDPGKTTGVAAALLNLKRATTMKTLMKRAVSRGALEVGQIDGDYWTQANRLYRVWTDFVYTANAEKGVAIPNIHLVIEQFQLRQKDTELWPVEVRSGLVTLCSSDGTWASFSLSPAGRLHFQTPSEAMGYATSERMRRWGVWTVGAEHGRDATKHLCLRASKLMSGEDDRPTELR